MAHGIVATGWRRPTSRRDAARTCYMTGRGPPCPNGVGHAHTDTARASAAVYDATPRGAEGASRHSAGDRLLALGRLPFAWSIAYDRHGLCDHSAHGM